MPLALVATFPVMYALGYSVNNLSLMALTIAVGFVVDDAIVMIENIVRHIEKGEPPLQAAFKGASEIGFTIVSITISLVAVFIPLLLMGGMVGRLFREFAVTVTAAIVLGFVSLTLTPDHVRPLPALRTAGRTRPHRAVCENAASTPCGAATIAAALGARHQRLTLAATIGLDALRLAVRSHPQGLVSAAGYRFRLRHGRGRQDISYAAMVERQRK